MTVISKASSGLWVDLQPNIIVHVFLLCNLNSSLTWPVIQLILWSSCYDFLLTFAHEVALCHVRYFTCSCNELSNYHFCCMFETILFFCDHVFSFTVSLFVNWLLFQFQFISLLGLGKSWMCKAPTAYSKKASYRLCIIWEAVKVDFASWGWGRVAAKANHMVPKPLFGAKESKKCMPYATSFMRLNLP